VVLAVDEDGHGFDSHLIGASLLSGGDDNRYDMAIKAVTVFVNSQNHTAIRWMRESRPQKTGVLELVAYFLEDLPSQILFESIGRWSS
jgi:hypothetical protein